MGKAYKFCQSCSMPMKKDPEGGGTNKDGSKSDKYCSYCLEAGAFLNPEIDTSQKMQKFCITKMKEGGMGGIAAWLLTRNIPNLERWKS